MKYIVLVVFSFLALMVIPTSCAPEEICLSNQHAVQTGFYSAYSVKKDTALARASVYGIGQDSLVYKDARIGKMFLTLSFSSDTTIFIINNNTLLDTLWFRHSKSLEFISRDCGFTWNFIVDSVWHTNTFVDSVSISYPPVNYGENIENIKIFLY